MEKFRVPVLPSKEGGDASGFTPGIRVQRNHSSVASLESVVQSNANICLTIDGGLYEKLVGGFICPLQSCRLFKDIRILGFLKYSNTANIIRISYLWTIYSVIVGVGGLKKRILNEL